MKEKLKHICRFLLKCLGIAIQLWLTCVTLLGLLMFVGTFISAISNSQALGIFGRIVICISVSFAGILVGVIFVKTIEKLPDHIKEAWRKSRK